MHCVCSSIEAQFLIVCCTSMCSCDSVHACMYALLVCCVHSPCQMAKCTLAMHVAIIILQSISFNTVDSRHNHAKYDSCTHRSRRRASEHIETYWCVSKLCACNTCTLFRISQTEVKSSKYREGRRHKCVHCIRRTCERNIARAFSYKRTHINNQHACGCSFCCCCRFCFCAAIIIYSCVLHFLLCFLLSLLRALLNLFAFMLNSMYCTFYIFRRCFVTFWGG